MNKEEKLSRKTFSFMIVGLLLIVFNGKSFLSSIGDKLIQIPSTPTFDNGGPTSTPWGPTPKPLCTSWNLSSEFRISPYQENPNRDLCNHLGVWEFMGSTSLIRNPSTYYRAPTFIPAAGGYQGLDFWYGTYVDGNGSFPAIGYNGSLQDRFFPSGGGQITLPVNAVDVHPAPNQLGIIAWHSPISGYISVTGGVSDNDPNGGDGILWYIDKNSAGIASGGISNGSNSSQIFASGTGGASLNTISVIAGDTIYLAIHPNGSYFYDNTRVDLVISRTATPTQTATITRTPTRTLTPTTTPTNTPPPNHGGSGKCWASKSSWKGYTVSYTIDRNTIPVSLGWDASIYAAAQTWSYVTPSHFVFVPSTGSSNTISYETPLNGPYALAEVMPYYSNSFFHITEKQIRINPYYIPSEWDTNNTPDPNNPDSNGSTTTYNVQNVVTHEFGHWLQLGHPDPNDLSCTDVTMYGSGPKGEIKRISLESADIEAINWQYP